MIDTILYCLLGYFFLNNAILAFLAEETDDDKEWKAHQYALFALPVAIYSLLEDLFKK